MPAAEGQGERYQGAEEDGREAWSAGSIPAISCATLPRLVDRDEVIRLMKEKMEEGE